MPVSMVIANDLLNALTTITVSHILLSPFKEYHSQRRKKDSGLMPLWHKGLLICFIREKQLSIEHWNNLLKTLNQRGYLNGVWSNSYIMCSELHDAALPNSENTVLEPKCKAWWGNLQLHLILTVNLKFMCQIGWATDAQKVDQALFWVLLRGYF